jgi:hypothetical protein
MGNSTANMGYGTEQCRQAVSNHGSVHHVMFSRDRRNVKLSAFSLFFSGFPGKYPDIILNYSINSTFQIPSNALLVNRETALMDCVKFSL